MFKDTLKHEYGRCTLSMQYQIWFKFDFNLSLIFAYISALFPSVFPWIHANGLTSSKMEYLLLYGVDNVAKWTLPSYTWNSPAHNPILSYKQPVRRGPNMKFQVFESPVTCKKKQTQPRKTPYRLKILGSRSTDPRTHSYDRFISVSYKYNWISLTITGKQ